MPSLNPAQKRAVEYLDGPLLVIAGPGTGKTELLSSKVEYILEQTDTDPGDILCITFTEAGANNMRERLLSKIGQAAHRLNIHTYHAFGADLLQQYKNYATTFTRNLNEAVDPVTQHKIMSNLINYLDPFDILKTARPADLLDTISAAKSARLTPEDLAKIAKSNLATASDLNPAAAEILKNLVPRMPYDDAMVKVYAPLSQLFEKYRSDQPIVKNIYPETNFILDELSAAAEKSLAGKKPSVAPLTAWKNKIFEKDDAGNFRLKNLVANKKLQSLAEIYRAYQAYLEKEGLYDFDDMIEEAISTLKTDEGFRLTLSERYQYILLDEFQDTNPSQFELIQLLTDYDRPNVMAVGDDDQAIFAFQGASASNLLDFQKHYGAEVISLTENYRSTAEILQTSHLVAEQIEDSFAKKQSLPKLLHANRAAKSTLIERHEFISADAEYYWVAEKVRGLIKSGEKQSDIAIITPKHKYILPLIPYLKTYPEINISYEKRENVLEDQKIHELLTLSRYLYEVANEKRPSHRLLEILSFPFLQLNPLDIIQEKNTDSVLKLLNELALESFNAPLELFLDKVIEKTNFLSFYTQHGGYSEFELYENLSVLREAIRAHTKTERPKLKDLITFLDDYESAGASVSNTSPYQDSADSVQLLTAHKAKGLEFKHVFIIACDNLAWGKAKGNNNFLALPKNLASIRHTGTTDSELLRLFFVALTRAKENLFITNSLKNFAGKSPDRLAYLGEHLDENNNLLSPLIPTGKVTTHYDDLEAAKKKTDLRKSWLSAYTKLTPELKPILLKRLENYQLTASDLTTFIDIVYAGPLEFYKRKVLNAPAPPATDEILFGNLVHTTFEKVTKESLSGEDALAFYQTSALNLPVEQHRIDQLLEKGAKSLAISLQAFRDILRAEHSGAEVDFYREHIVASNVPLTGKIDHLIADPKEKTVEIYDFKTGKFHGEKWDAHQTLFKYKLQLGLYKLLVENSKTYQGYHVNRAHILFVTPDDDEKVYDKLYEYNDRDEAALKELIAAVYHEIKTLGFLDRPELALEPDPTKTLKHIKDFIALVLAART